MGVSVPLASVMAALRARGRRHSPANGDAPAIWRRGASASSPPAIQRLSLQPFVSRGSFGDVGAEGGPAPPRPLVRCAPSLRPLEEAPRPGVLPRALEGALLPPPQPFLSTFFLSPLFLFPITEYLLPLPSPSYPPPRPPLLPIPIPGAVPLKVCSLLFQTLGGSQG